MYGLNNTTVVKEQYASADNLNTRISIHDKYSTNKTGFGNWIMSNYKIEPGMKVLELGCGTGDMWIGRHDIIRKCSRLVLSDFSKGMTDTAKAKLGACDHIEYMVIDIQEIPFEDHSFDAVIANMMLYHVPDLLSPYGVEDKMNKNFTLQNGREHLGKVFPQIEKLEYEDSLRVTDADDMADYICSLSSMSALNTLPKETVKKILTQHMTDGVLEIPKEYGMFIAYQGCNEDKCTK